MSTQLTDYNQAWGEAFQIYSNTNTNTFHFYELEYEYNYPSAWMWQSFIKDEV